MEGLIETRHIVIQAEDARADSTTTAATTAVWILKISWEEDYIKAGERVADYSLGVFRFSS